MIVNRFRLLYSLGFRKPALPVPPCDTLRIRCFCSEIQSDLKPEDTFGNFVPHAVSHSSQDYDEDDAKNSAISIPEAIIQMRNHINAYNFDKAKEIFDEFKKTKKPPPYLYKLLLASAARLGKAEEAYKLYNDLKKRGLYADGAIFTSLFYACAKCHRKDIALPIADKLMKHLLENQKRKPNTTNFNVLLMAYSRHGDMSTVMQILDRLEKEGRNLSTHTFNYALECCISLPNSGLRFAILLWHHILKKQQTPNLYTFTVLARCVRDCSLGDSALCESFINSVFANCPSKEISRSPKKGGLEKEYQAFLESGQIGRNVKELSSLPNNEESKENGTVLDVEINQPEMVQSTGDVTLNNENDEKTEQHPHSIKAESSNNFGQAAGSYNEDSQCITRDEIAASDKAVTLTAGNNEQLLALSETAEGSQLAEVKSADEFKSEAATHRFDEADLPNVLTLKPPGKSIIHYGDFSIPENRLMLFGGLNGFLETVKSYKVVPKVQLFSILLQCIPSTEKDEEELMRQMKKYNVRVDTIFLNILIGRRIFRNEESAPECWLELFETYKCAPDVVTFGIIACSCVTHEKGKKCIELARSHNIRLNNIVLCSLLGHAKKTKDMAYVSDILKAAKEDEIELNAVFVTTLKNIVDNEKKNRRQAISR